MKKTSLMVDNLVYFPDRVEEPGRLQVAESDMTEQLHFHFQLYCIINKTFSFLKTFNCG